MKYISTRGDKTERGFSEILLEGLAPDGGLYLPTSYPKIDDATLTKWRGLSYAELAFEILSLYIDDIPASDLKALAAKTVQDRFLSTGAELVPEPLQSSTGFGDYIRKEFEATREAANAAGLKPE